jgi:hypothetical protein
MRASREISLIILTLLIVSLLNHVFAEPKDSDLDGISDAEDEFPFDYDNDGMPDIWEKRNGLRYDAVDANEDPYNDGITNIEEYKQGTNPLLSAKTGEPATPPIMLSPVETTMARGLLWIAAGTILAFIIIFILYRAHIFRILRFVHHASKEHEAKQTHARQMLRHRYIPRHLRPQAGQQPLGTQQDLEAMGRPMQRPEQQAHPMMRPPTARIAPGAGQTMQPPLGRSAFVNRPIQEPRKKTPVEQPLAERTRKPIAPYKGNELEETAQERPERAVDEPYELPKRRTKGDAFGQLSKEIKKYQNSKGSLEELQDLAR